MRKRPSSEEQMVGILREADREPVAQVAKKHGVSERTISPVPIHEFRAMAGRYALAFRLAPPPG